MYTVTAKVTANLTETAILIVNSTVAEILEATFNSNSNCDPKSNSNTKITQ